MPSGYDRLVFDSDPYLGAIVHYRFVDPGLITCLAAIVTSVPEVGSQCVGLHVFTPPGTITEPFTVGDVPHSIQGEETTWHWSVECRGTSDRGCPG
jgi:hypothetical protein